MRKSRRIRCPERPRRFAAAALAIALPFFVGACSSPPEPEAAPPTQAERGPRLHFEYVTVDEKPLSSTTLAGRLSIIGFVATYDIASQLQARFLRETLKHHKPRINVALLVLEAPENKPLVQAFASTLELNYPVALADAATIAGEGPFKGLHHVPSVAILDREGREAWRRLGVSDEATLDAALKRIEADDQAGK